MFKESTQGCFWSRKCWQTPRENNQVAGSLKLSISRGPSLLEASSIHWFWISALQKASCKSGLIQLGIAPLAIRELS
ncbi:MAG: hypothetical protein DWH99_11765 [Planctomycetota bacterium]|nr:MAG: hypothetical protein DWH99_11765 [Planctomycetota bacterium]